MAKDIIITVNTETKQIIKNDSLLGISTENLQGKIIFKPTPFIDGVCCMHIENHGCIEMKKEEDQYTLDILSSLLIPPKIKVCFKITCPKCAEGVPVFATKIIDFTVLDTIDENKEIEEQYPSVIERLEGDIAEIEGKITGIEEDIANIEEQIENGDFGGSTPERGVDYWTEEDVKAMEKHCDDYIDEKIVNAIGGEY